MIRRAAGALTTHISGIIEEARQPLFIKQTIWTALFFALMVGTLIININFLRTTYPDAPQPPDLILDNFPQNDAWILVGESLSALQSGLIMLFFFSSRERFRHFPTMASLLIFMFMLRGFVITLTPLGQIQPPAENYAEDHWIAQTFYHGMFYSGHTASSMIQVMFFHRFKMRGVRLSWVLLPLTTIQIIALLGSHQHYTIDIFGGLMVAYFIVHCDLTQVFPAFIRDAAWAPWNDHTRQATQPIDEQPAYPAAPIGAEGSTAQAQDEMEYERTA